MQVRVDPSDNTTDEDPGDALTIAAIFAEVFELASVDIDDDFFELGGDLLLAEAAMTAIEKRFGPILSIAALYESPTPRALAGLLKDARASGDTRVLLTINPNGSPPPLFCVHGSEGQSVLPSRLSQAIGNRALYAYRAIGLEGGERPVTTIEAMADTYLKSILSICPAWPPCHAWPVCRLSGGVRNGATSPCRRQTSRRAHLDRSSVAQRSAPSPSSRVWSGRSGKRK